MSPVRPNGPAPTRLVRIGGWTGVLGNGSLTIDITPTYQVTISIDPLDTNGKPINIDYTPADELLASAHDLVAMPPAQFVGLRERADTSNG